MSSLRTSPDDLCAITCFYNPSNYKTRLANYETFRARFAPGLRLLTIECAFGDSDFALGVEDCLRVRSKDVLWQKERLLNVAARHVPPQCKKIVWLDCDLIFENEEWPQLTSQLLNTAAVVQPFSQVVWLPNGADCDNGHNQRWTSFAAVYEAKPNMMVLGRYHEHGHTGFAWAARRELFERVGLYDACVIGNGDHVMAHAFCGDWESPCLSRIFGQDSASLMHFHDWCQTVYPLIRAQVKAVSGGLLHMWHGDIKDRNYVLRNLGLIRLRFNPYQDLAIDAGGCWTWSGEKAQELENWARNYFSGRKEDGDPSEITKDSPSVDD